MDTLFHYCSTSSFYSIISNRSLRLSSLSLSNDSMEGKLVSKRTKALAVEDGIDELTLRRLGEYLEALEDVIDGLGFCLSEESDLLSQWRGYADNAAGLSIGFSRKYLDFLSYPNKTWSGFSLRQVEYDEARQIELLRPSYLKIKELIQQGAFKEAENQKVRMLLQSLETTVWLLFSDLFVLKGHAFCEEKEWRLLAISFGNGTEESYRPSGDRLIPYREIPLTESSIDPIYKVILGPRNRTPINVISGFLQKSGFKNVLVTRSVATYLG